MLEKLKEIGDQFLDCLVIVDVDAPGRPCLYVNEKFTNLTGYSREELLNKNLAMLQNGKTPAHITNFLRHRFKKKEACLQDLINYKKDGTPFLNRAVMIPFLSTSGKTLYLGIQNDISRKLDALGNDKLQKVQGSEICHYYNNLLMKILARFDFDKRDEKLSLLLEELNEFSFNIEKKSEFDAFEYI